MWNIIKGHGWYTVMMHKLHVQCSNSLLGCELWCVQSCITNYFPSSWVVTHTPTYAHTEIPVRKCLENTCTAAEEVGRK